MANLRNTRPTRFRLAALLLGISGLTGMVGCPSAANKEAKACKAACPIAVMTVCTASGKEYDSKCLAECAGEKDITEGNCSAAKGKKKGP